MPLICHSLKYLTLLKLKLGFAVPQLRLGIGAFGEDGKYKAMKMRLQLIDKLT